MSRARRTVLAVAVAFAVVAASAPAEAVARPSKVGLVSFTAGSLSGGKATLTFVWPKAAGASTYEIFVSPDYDRVLDQTTPYRKTSSTSITLGGLVPGRSYFVQVRGRNSAGVGSRSSRVGRTTIVSHSATTHTNFRVMTFNVCSEKSGCMTPWSWSTRRPRVLERITTVNPDVLTLQESKALASSDVDGAPSAVLPGYVRAFYSSSKALYFKDARFDLAARDDVPRAGSISLGNGRYAVWAELLDARNPGQHILAVSAHLTPGKDATAAALRSGETTKLLSGVAAANDTGLNVVIAGDFNSHKNRSNDTVGRVMNGAGYRDAYDLAEKVTNQHYNSYNGYAVTAATSVKWGDHVDHVWVKPALSRVLTWVQRGLRSGSKYLTPIPSDHHAVSVDVRLQ
jgi:endonuclease/exonuclease/phosphatase family metal-dependent hydrolase